MTVQLYRHFGKSSEFKFVAEDPYMYIVCSWQGRQWPYMLGDATHCRWWKPMYFPVASECQLERMVATLCCWIITHHNYAGSPKTHERVYRETETRESIKIVCICNAMDGLTESIGNKQYWPLLLRLTYSFLFIWMCYWIYPYFFWLDIKVLWLNVPEFIK